MDNLGIVKGGASHLRSLQEEKIRELSVLSAYGVVCCGREAFPESLRASPHFTSILSFL